MMPAIHSMRLAVRPSRSALMIGMPPATAASNATITPFACAAAKISLPCCASSALLAVTTCLPLRDRLAARACARARCRRSARRRCRCPDARRTIAASSVRLTPVAPRVPLARALERARRRSSVMRIGRPARRAISSSLRRSTSHVPEPDGAEAEQADVQRFHLRACHRRPARRHSNPSSRNICLMPRIACRVRALVLDHREAHVLVAVLAEADARRHRDLRLGEQLLRELERAQLRDTARESSPTRTSTPSGCRPSSPPRAGP